MPTRNARNGMLFTANGTINIKKKMGTDSIDEMGITCDRVYKSILTPSLQLMNIWKTNCNDT
jgi:queuine/archaeosine tRNA-ribosyltransferase